MKAAIAISGPMPEGSPALKASAVTVLPTSALDDAGFRLQLFDIFLAELVGILVA